MEMGKNRGKGRRKEDFCVGIWEKAIKQRNDGRRSKLQQEQRQLMALPDRGDTSEHWGGTSLTHDHIHSVQLQRRGERGENGRIEVWQQKTQSNRGQKGSRKRKKAALPHAESLPIS